MNLTIPGGCSFQSRPIDEHIRLFTALGYSINLESDKIIAIKTKDISNITYTFQIKSVGATINALLYLVCSKTRGVLYNCNLDPEVLEVIKFLRLYGANIILCDNHIRITPTLALTKINYKVTPCRIEQISYASLVLYPKVDKVTLTNYNTTYIKSYLSFLKKYNIDITYKYHKLILSKSNKFTYDVSFNELLTFGSYPLFSTDTQAIIVTSLLNFKLPINFIDLIYPNRDSILTELSTIGVKYNNHKYYTIYEKHFSNNSLNCCDLRCGFALFSLIFLNEFRQIKLHNCQYILRGYNSFLETLKLNGICYEAI